MARGKKNNAKRRKKNRRKQAPLVTARVSIDGGGGLNQALNNLWSEVSAISALFPFEIYKIMDNLALTDSYVRKFVVDTQGLGNQGHQIEIDAPTERRAVQAVQIVNDLAARISPLTGGADGLHNGFFGQIARTGGLCAEAPPFEDLSGVTRAHLIKMQTVRWRRTREGELELCQLQRGEIVPLNPVQTVFLSASFMDENPYPIPPIIGALEPISTHRLFMSKLRGWIEKLASMGVLAAITKPPQQKGNEPDEEYDRRAQEVLQQFTQSLSDNFTHGVAAAYDPTQFKYTNTNAGAAGAEKMAQLILQSLFSGLLRDPVFFGHNFNTTETFATVVFRVLCAQIANYQQIVKRAYEHILRLELALKGMGDLGVSVTFNLKDVLDEFQAAEAVMMEGRLLLDEMLANAISVKEYRIERGYDEPKASSGSFVAAFNKAANHYRLLPPPKRWSGVNFPEDDRSRDRFDLSDIDRPPRRITIQAELSASQREARDSARWYLREMQKELTQAGRSGVDAMMAWAQVHRVPEAERFAVTALDRFVTGAESALDQNSLTRMAQGYLDTIWEFGRNDPDLFGPDWDESRRGVGVMMGGPDKRAIGYLSRVDGFYASNYLTNDPRTTDRLKQWLTDHHFKGGRSISDKKLLKQFKEEFKDLVDSVGLTRARQIVSTAVSRAQNWGGIITLDESEVVTYRWAGPWDSLCCDWCDAMRTKKFSVRRDRERIEGIIETGNEEIAKFDQFVTSRFPRKDGVKALRSLSGEEVQATGMAAPPAHPDCRHRQVALVERRSANDLTTVSRFSPPSVVEFSFHQARYDLAA